MEITKTVVKFINLNGTTVEFQGNRDVATVKAALVGSFGWIANAQVSEATEGSTKVITFTESTGTKG